MSSICRAFDSRKNSGGNSGSASDFFQEWWAIVTHGAKNGGSFSEMMGPKIC